MILFHGLPFLSRLTIKFIHLFSLPFAGLPRGKRTWMAKQSFRKSFTLVMSSWQSMDRRYVMWNMQQNSSVARLVIWYGLRVVNGIQWRRMSPPNDGVPEQWGGGTELTREMKRRGRLDDYFCGPFSYFPHPFLSYLTFSFFICYYYLSPFDGSAWHWSLQLRQWRGKQPLKKRQCHNDYFTCKLMKRQL